MRSSWSVTNLTLARAGTERRWSSSIAPRAARAGCAFVAAPQRSGHARRYFGSLAAQTRLVDERLQPSPSMSLSTDSQVVEVVGRHGKCRRWTEAVRFASRCVAWSLADRRLGASAEGASAFTHCCSISAIPLEQVAPQAMRNHQIIDCDAERSASVRSLQQHHRRTYLPF